MRIADYFDAAANRYPERLAFADAVKHYPYAEARRWVHAIAHALREAGLKAGAHIAIYSPNDARVSLLHLGVNRADMVWLSVHIGNAVKTNCEILEAFDAEAVFFHSHFEADVETLKQGLTKAKYYICIDRPSAHGPMLEEWLADCWQPFPVTREHPLAPTLIQPTGGTTGPSKGVVHTHQSLEMMLVAALHAMETQDQAKNLVVAPLTHGAGVTALAMSILNGSNYILPGYDPDAVLSTIERERITHLFLPPTAVYHLLAYPASGKTDFSSLRCFIVSAAPMAPEKFRSGIELFGPVLFEIYGQSETLVPILVKRPRDYLKADGSIDEEVLSVTGKPTPYAQVTIVDDNGEPQKLGEPGEIAVRSSMVMQGYYKMPEQTATTIKHGWHLTTDIGVMDERGYFTVIDRKKDMIISGGFNIYPVEIERVINSLPAVLDCAVIGVPDDKWGEAVKAVIQLKESQSATEEQVISLCKEELGSLKAPKSVEFWPDLPRSVVGKVLKREVREHFWQGRGRSI